MEWLAARRCNKETGSPFDATIVSDVGLPPPIHHLIDAPPEPAAFSRGAACGASSSSSGPRDFLRARSGTGGAASTAMVALAHAPVRARTAPAPRLTLLLPPAGGGDGGGPMTLRGPPPAGARAVRPNPPNSAFRRA